MLTTFLKRFTVSDRETMAHVGRRLGMGTHALDVADAESVEDMIGRMLDLSGEPADLPWVEVPRHYDDIGESTPIEVLGTWWIDQMSNGYQPIVERLCWFWHDHFAVSYGKVGNAWLLWRHHRLVRRHATGNFGELLRAVATDPAMLVYLDGGLNTAHSPNENFGREVMELYTTGPGHYEETEVAAASRAASGWKINWASWEHPGQFDRPDLPPWDSYLLEDDRDNGHKRLHNRSGDLGMDELVETLLDHPATGPFIAAKMYRELVGVEPDEATRERLGSAFAKDYEIMPLVEAIVSEPAFLDPRNHRNKIRTPLERLIALRQGFEIADSPDAYTLWWWLGGLEYQPFEPPNPAGFPRGSGLLSPGMLVNSFLLLEVVGRPDDSMGPADILRRLALYDLSADTRRVLDRHWSSPATVFGLAFGSPEFAQT